jgi:hypothetical protein
MSAIVASARPGTVAAGIAFLSGLVALSIQVDQVRRKSRRGQVFVRDMIRLGWYGLITVGCLVALLASI